MSERALVITGDPAVKALLVPVLEGLGLEPSLSASVTLAASSLDEGSFSLIVLDREQPEGQSAFVFLRQLKSQGVEAPVLLISTNASPEDLLAGFRLGAAEVVRKPVRAGLIGAALSRLLPATES